MNAPQHNTVRKVLFVGPRRVQIASEVSRPISPTEVRIRTICSGISRGTEMNIYRGEASFFAKGYDASLRLFRDSNAWAYPMEFGYENVGRIEEVGCDVSGYAPGDVVLTYCPHREECIIDAETREPLLGDVVPILPLPAEMPPEHGVFLPLLGVAFNAMLDAQLLLTETVAVMGAGVVGLLMIQLARRAGAGSICVVEPAAQRRRAALDLGADLALDPAADDVAAQVRALTSGRGADVAIDVSGSYRGLQEAIRLVGYNGRVIVSSWLNGAARDLNLGEEFHLNRVRIFSSQSLGTSPLLADRWDNARRTNAALNLLTSLTLNPLITHRIPFERAADAFELVDRNSEKVLQVLLIYGGST